jgi:FkbM family methyltransferase
MKTQINLWLGNVAAALGYTVRRSFRIPNSTADFMGIALRLVQRHVNGPIHILQVGAYDGEKSDPLSRYLSDESIPVQALLLEPQPEPFKRLVEKYQHRKDVTPINAAIAKHSGFIDLYTVNTERGSMMASTSPNHIERFGKDTGSLVAIKVPALSPHDLLKQNNWHEVHILQIDTEGMDWQIAKMFLETQIQPLAINFEKLHLAKHVLADAQATLANLNYQRLESEYDCCALANILIHK